MRTALADGSGGNQQKNEKSRVFFKKALDLYCLGTVYLGMKNDKKTKGNEMILLESVGTYLDTTNGMTYPAYINNEPDLENGHPVNDIEEDEWMLSLSEEDFDVVANYLSGLV